MIFWKTELGEQFISADSSTIVRFLSFNSLRGGIMSITDTGFTIRCTADTKGWIGTYYAFIE